MKFYLKMLILFIALIGSAFLVKRYFDPAERPEKQKSVERHEYISDDDFAYRAYVISKTMVKSNLKSPSTADFPFSDYRYTRVNTNQIIIEGYVDSQNSFGATVRNSFNIELKYNGGPWSDESNWQLISIDFN